MTSQTTIDFTAAQERAVVGIERSAKHANRVESEWTGQALGLLRRFIQERRREPFLMEAARQWAETQGGLPHPPDARAWGAVTRAAAHRQLIEKCGAAPASSSNGSPKHLWRGTETFLGQQHD